jgi:hypothetical protein
MPQTVLRLLRAPDPFQGFDARMHLARRSWLFFGHQLDLHAGRDEFKKQPRERDATRPSHWARNTGAGEAPRGGEHRARLAAGQACHSAASLALIHRATLKPLRDNDSDTLEHVPAQDARGR